MDTKYRRRVTHGEDVGSIERKLAENAYPSASSPLDNGREWGQYTQGPSGRVKVEPYSLCHLCGRSYSRPPTPVPGDHDAHCLHPDMDGNDLLCRWCSIDSPLAGRTSAYAECLPTVGGEESDVHQR